MKKKHLSLKERSTYHCLEDVIGCKWSVGVVAAIAEGVRRPGELERYIPGISKKVLNERLRKLQAFNILTRLEFDDSMPHVEYHLTQWGEHLASILRQVGALRSEMEKSDRPDSEA